MIYRLLYLLLIFLSSAPVVFARGGGGGSGGGGGGGGGSGGSGGSSGGGNIYSFIFVAIIFASTYLFIYLQKLKKIKKAKLIIEKASSEDSNWGEDIIKKRVSEVFYAFQKDWSEFNTDNMKSYTTSEYFKRMVLELNVLKNESRQNIMKNVVLKSISIIEASDEIGTNNDSFVAEIQASAEDSLIDIKTGETLYMDNSSFNFGFTEYWHFTREENIWKLNIIKQKTEDVSMSEGSIKDFAERNKFYYDPDFGWLMMPNKGVIFSANNFTSSDINNHVIGYFKDKIIEFYTFIPNSNSRNPTNYLVAQTVLPISYKDILVRRKRMLFNFSPSGLRRTKTESNDFDKKFCLWAHKDDQINSFEFLSPDFMEKIYQLPFELNIEIVGNFIYFYSKGRSGIDYDKMLEILSLSFDEMKM